MSNAIEFNIAGCDTLVGQSMHTIYHYPHKEALIVITDIHSRGYEWVFNGSNQNDTLDHSPYEWSYTTKLQIDSGQEAMAQFEVGALFKGLSMNISESKRVFSETETATATSHKAIVTVRPGSTAHVWQKRYRFRIEIWFRLDAWGSNWTVGDRELGPDGNNVILQREGEIHIDANEYRSTLVNLSGQRQTSVVPMQVGPRPPIREWEKLTDLSRAAIRKEINI